MKVILGILRQETLPDSRDIRLLQILPGKAEEQIVCELLVVSLNDELYYEALSYTWGMLVMEKRIIVNGSTFLVTSNLELALRHLRDPARSRVIWADLICINQQDEDEKSSQVRLMGDIYRRASRCLVWLGNFQDQGLSESDAMQTFEIVRALSKSRHFNELVCFDEKSVTQVEARRFVGLKLLLSNAWWQRIWTVQEVVLPKRSLVVWGTQRLPFHILTDATKSVVDHRGSCCCEFHATFSDALKTILVTFTSSVGGIKAVHDPNVLPTIPLRDLLWRFRYRQASNPKDKVFGLLGMIKDFKNALRLDLDYAMTLTEIYTEVGLEILREDCSFTFVNYSLISLVGHRGEPTNIENLPSWTTDWSVAAPSKARYWCHRFRYDWFSCDGGRKMNLTIDKKSSSLCLEGILVDTITKIGAPLVRDDTTEAYDAEDLCSDAQELCCVLREWLRLCPTALSHKTCIEDPVKDWEHQMSLIVPEWSNTRGRGNISTFSNVDEKYVTGETHVDAFWHAMLGGLILHPDGGQPLRKCCRSDYALLAAMLDTETWTNSPGLNLSLQQWLKDQTFFMTRQGYIGTGPGTVRNGDQVWILFGSNVPFILRGITAQNRAGKDKLNEDLSEVQDFVKIGDCYVHGIMQGEILRDPTNRSRRINLF
ncbi:uncharacterized protein PAC_09844 [Phialocephala subalpina]|uniref:Heterokaryon incompatibility domain-containing protein n=1 Tax=Phialocephala subalpina TaxID=576137 RepID=A0A1L7X4K5_9HELO|nr:uncharacterized protein PAC_09844 [Phialocephala subalpina]